MTPDEQSRELHLGQSDALTPAQLRRFQLWRALVGLSKAQAEGRLTPEQACLLESLAEKLQQLAAQLNQLAELGQQYAQLLEASHAALVPVREPAPRPEASASSDG